MAVRNPAVADRFYVGRADRLTANVERYIEQARTTLAERSHPAGRLRAVVSPHAGYIYSGPTAGFSYALLDPAVIRRVLLLGPAHYLPVPGMALSSALAWRTPLGEVPIDQSAAAELRASFDNVFFNDAAHAPEHSLEVQLPFLQVALSEGWTLVPILVGADLREEVSAVIAKLAATPETLVVVSSDLSHYLDYDSARARDARTLEAVKACDALGVKSEDACGRHPLRGLLTYAKARGWQAEVLDARNSGDTAGDTDRVVGYASVGFWEPTVPATGTPSAQGAVGADERPTAKVRLASPVPSTAADRAGTPTAPADTAATLSAGAQERLLRLARAVISNALGVAIDAAAGDWQRAAAEFPELGDPGASFVTLRTRAGDLLGCIGSLTPHQPLAADVAAHAYDAAFRDPRFTPISSASARTAVIDISVLGPTVPFPAENYDYLIARFPRGRGIVVEAGRHRATFLPAVWEQLPGPEQFVAALWRKAGLAHREWPAETRISAYEVLEFAEPGSHAP